MKDTYQTIQVESIGEFRDRGSKFIAYAYPVFSEAEWHEKLEIVKKRHIKARHFCYAFRLGLDKNNFRANDDGEPSGTAGRPILGQIDSFGLTNVIIVVVRYFGGTKLGTSGLINAYRTAAMEALQTATIEERKVEDLYRITFNYALMSNVMNAVKKQGLEITKQDFGDIGILEIAIAQSEIATHLLQLKAQIAKVRIEEVEKLENIEGLEIEYLSTRV